MLLNYVMSAVMIHETLSLMMNRLGKTNLWCTRADGSRLLAAYCRYVF